MTGFQPGAQGYRVWAPRAESVTLLADGRRFAMERSGGGWFHAAEDAAVVCRPEVDYGYLLDDDPTPLPDPRSRRQPAGVHELSRTFAADAHRWQDGSWTGRRLPGSSVYEMHVGTFTPEGTFDAAAGRLDHLAGLGVGFVELLPVNAFNGPRNWGYDGVLWYAVQEQYGGPAGYQRFVDACHAAGIGVIQDVVYNHLGPSGNYLPRFGPYLHSGSRNTWGDSVNLDGPDSDEVRRYILDNALMWLDEYHVDGLRLDAVHALVDRRALHILEELAAEVDRLSARTGRPLTLIAESDLNDPRLITGREAGGYGLHGQWSDDFHHAVHTALTGETTGYYRDFAGLEPLAKVLRSAYFHDGSYSSFRRRRHGRPVDTLRMPTHRFVVCTQNHDQIGNRAAGDRLSANVDAGALGIAAVLNLAGPFTPMLFMGEEWGASTPWQFFTSHPEPELGAATAEGRLREFAEMGWDPELVPDPQEESTFLRSQLDWSEREEGGHGRLLALYRALGALRKERPELTDPRFGTIGIDVDESARRLVLRRGGLLIAVNFSEHAQAMPLPAPAGELLLDTAAFLEPGDHPGGPAGTMASAGPQPGRSARIYARPEGTPWRQAPEPDPIGGSGTR